MRINGFAREIETKIKRTYEIETRRVMIAGVRAAYQHIMTTWPVWSGYSAANNRISITGRDIALVQPSSRTARQGAHVAKIAATYASEMAKLDRITYKFGMRPRIIVLGNPVSYEGTPGGNAEYLARGRAIYQTAARIGEQIASAVAR